MTLFTKENCGKCDHIKEAFDLKKMGINIAVIKPDDPEMLADLAWYELVDAVEKGALPILLLDDDTHIKYEIPVRRYLERHIKAKNA